MPLALLGRLRKCKCLLESTTIEVAFFTKASPVQGEVANVAMRRVTEGLFYYMLLQVQSLSLAFARQLPLHKGAFRYKATTYLQKTSPSGVKKHFARGHFLLIA